jgi:wobble nucleotide-excising tRNase
MFHSTLISMKKYLNVNDQLYQFSGTQAYHTSPTVPHQYTDGVQYLAQTFNCYWLLRLIGFQSNQIDAYLQVWKLKRCQSEDDEFVLICEDGNRNQLYQVEILYSDFKGDEVTLYLINEILLVPSEY